MFRYCLEPREADQGRRHSHPTDPSCLQAKVCIREAYDDPDEQPDCNASPGKVCFVDHAFILVGLGSVDTQVGELLRDGVRWTRVAEESRL